jgi:hypothetical protein
MKSVIHSLLAAVSSETTCQHALKIHLRNRSLLGVELDGLLALAMQLLVVTFTDTSPESCLCRSGHDKLLDMTNYRPLPTRILISLGIVIYEKLSLNG